MLRRDVFPHIADFGLHHGALFGGRKLEHYFDRLLEGRTFADLKRRLVVVTTDIDSGEEVLLESGSLALALRASASIPGVFAPANVDGRRLIDGGIGSPVPLKTLESLDVEVALGIGAGMEARDSGTIRLARKVLTTSTGQRLHQSAVTRTPQGPLGRLGRAAALAASGWIKTTETPESGTDGYMADGEGAIRHDARGATCRRLEVHTRPPINWLNFHRAADAIRAGDAALSRIMPRLKQALQPG